MKPCRRIILFLRDGRRKPRPPSSSVLCRGSATYQPAADARDKPEHDGVWGELLEHGQRWLTEYERSCNLLLSKPAIKAGRRNLPQSP
ncbi:hypothetical protein ELH83_03215 [Rhizobium leguminosarum]|nr:hypothetical protein ELH83_03215 [Rhizobium leguminosarum]